MLDASGDIRSELSQKGAQAVVFALPNISAERKRELYETYAGMGYKIKSYDYPVMESSEGVRRQLREFDIEELLFRRSSPNRIRFAIVKQSSGN